jgi:hypothetical protein
VSRQVWCKYILFRNQRLLEQLSKGKQIAYPAYQSDHGEVMNPDKNAGPAAKAFTVVAIQ